MPNWTRDDGTSDFSVKTVQPCAKCVAETRHKKACPVCKAPVVFVAKKRVKAPLESDVKKRLRALVIAEGCLCWVHNVDNRLMFTGLGLGTADLICVVPPFGRFLGIELKRPGYSPSDVSDNQRSWLAAVRRFGGVSGIATCEAEALALIREARQESRTDDSRTPT